MAVACNTIQGHNSASADKLSMIIAAMNWNFQANMSMYSTTQYDGWGHKVNLGEQFYYVNGQL